MWVLTTRKTSEGLDVHVGSVLIARVGWRGSLMLMDEFAGDFKTVKLALQEVKRRLSAPPPE